MPRFRSETRLIANPYHFVSSLPHVTWLSLHFFMAVIVLLAARRFGNGGAAGASEIKKSGASRWTTWKMRLAAGLGAGAAILVVVGAVCFDDFAARRLGDGA
jgi:hypothetical protein